MQLPQQVKILEVHKLPIILEDSLYLHSQCGRGWSVDLQKWATEKDGYLLRSIKQQQDSRIRRRTAANP
jgi:hypothetical protein